MCIYAKNVMNNTFKNIPTIIINFIMFAVGISIFYLGSYFMGTFPQKSLTTNQFSRLLLYLMCTQTNRICSKRRPYTRSLIPGSRDSPNFECLPLVTSPMFVLLTRVCIFSLHNLSLRARPKTTADTLVNYNLKIVRNDWKAQRSATGMRMKMEQRSAKRSHPIGALGKH